LLSKAFSVQVRLTPPAEGQMLAAHRERLALDSSDEMAEINRRRLQAALSGLQVTLPSLENDVFRRRILSRDEWAKVLTWAISISLLRQSDTSTKATAPEGESQAAALAALAAPEEVDAGDDEAGSAGDDMCGTARRGVPTGEEVEGLSEEEEVEPGEFNESAATGKAESVEGEPEAAARNIRPHGGEPGAVPDGYAAGLQSASPADVTAAISPEEGKGLKASPVCEDRATVAEACRELVQTGAHKAELNHALLSHLAGEAPRTLCVEAADLNYGMAMLEQTGNKLRSTVTTSNAYEKRLLSEVLRPEEAGSGFGEVGALDKAKTALREAVQLPLQHPQLFTKGNLMRPCLGVLLFGPPGTGKSMLARAAAAECGATFLTLSPATVSSKWLGDGVRFVKAAFSLASKLAPSVIFIDEVDSMLGRRDSSSEHEALREIKNEFMANWDGIRAAGRMDRVMVVGATNRPHDLDEAVLRRFSKRVFCDLPDGAARLDILGKLMAEESAAPEVSLKKVAEATDGFSGSDLKNLCTAAAMRSVRELLASTGKSARDAQAKQSPWVAPEVQSACGTPAEDGGKAARGSVQAAGAPRSERHNNSAAATEVLAEWEQLAEQSKPPVLRPISQTDFDEARKEVTASVCSDSMSMNELREWNKRYGEALGASRGVKALSYFM
ncbi:hypothetical protein CYMTET_21103, partial [Cymbomonas tetramitiformis]